jgi:hypothetical protein
MSCRVMGRRVEQAFLSYLVEQAAAAGARKVRGLFVRTAKNTPVHDFYPQHGFTLVEEAGEGARAVYELTLASNAASWPAAIKRIDEEGTAVAGIRRCGHPIQIFAAMPTGGQIELVGLLNQLMDALQSARPGRTDVGHHMQTAQKRFEAFGVLLQRPPLGVGLNHGGALPVFSQEARLIQPCHLA